MEGITILATEAVTLGVPFWVAPLVGCITFILVLITLAIVSQETDTFDWGLGAICGILVTIFFLGLSVGTYKEETHYSMTIDETVSFVEFNEQYEVVDQKGDIYIVREKEVDKND